MESLIEPDSLDEFRIEFEARGTINGMHFLDWEFEQIWTAMNEGLVSIGSLHEQFQRKYGTSEATEAYKNWSQNIFNSINKNPKVNFLAVNDDQLNTVLVKTPNFQSAFGLNGDEDVYLLRALQKNGGQYEQLGMSYEAIGFLLENRAIPAQILYANRSYFLGKTAAYMQMLGDPEPVKDAETYTAYDRSLRSMEIMLRNYYNYPIEEQVIVPSNGDEAGAGIRKALQRVTRAVVPTRRTTVYQKFHDGNNGEDKLDNNTIYELFKNGILNREILGYDPIRRRTLYALTALAGILAAGGGIGEFLSSIEAFARGDDPAQALLKAGVDEHLIEQIEDGEIDESQLEELMQEAGFDEDAINEIRHLAEELGGHEEHEISTANLTTAFMVSGALFTQIGRILAFKETEAATDEKQRALMQKLHLNPIKGFGSETASIVWGAELSRMFILGLTDRKALLHDLSEHQSGFAPFPVLVILAELLSRTEVDLNKRFKLGDYEVDFAEFMPEIDQSDAIAQEKAQILSYRVAEKLNRLIKTRIGEEIAEEHEIRPDILQFRPEDIVELEEHGETAAMNFIRVEKADFSELSAEELEKLEVIQGRKLAEYFATVTGVAAGIGAVMTPYTSITLMNLGQPTIAEELLKLNYIKYYRREYNRLFKEYGDTRLAHQGVEKARIAMEAHLDMQTAMNHRVFGLDKFTMSFQGNTAGKWGPISDFPNIYFEILHPEMAPEHNLTGLALTTSNMALSSAIWLKFAGVSSKAVARVETKVIESFVKSVASIAQDGAEYASDRINPLRRVENVKTALGEFYAATTEQEIKLASQKLLRAFERTGITIFPTEELLREKARLITKWTTRQQGIGRFPAELLESLVQKVAPDLDIFTKTDKLHGENYTDIVTDQVAHIYKNLRDADAEVSQVLEKVDSSAIRQLIDLLVAIKGGDTNRITAHHQAIKGPNKVVNTADLYAQFTPLREKAEAIKTRLARYKEGIKGQETDFDSDYEEARDFLTKNPVFRLLGENFNVKLRIALDAYYRYKKDHVSKEYENAHYGTLGLSHNAEEVFFAILSQLPAVPAMVVVAEKVIPLVAGVEPGKPPTIAQLKAMVITTQVVESVISAIADNIAAYLFGEKFLGNQLKPIIEAAMEVGGMTASNKEKIMEAVNSGAAHQGIAAGTLTEAGNGPNWSTLVLEPAEEIKASLPAKDQLGQYSEDELLEILDNLKYKFNNLPMPESVSTAYALVDVSSTSIAVYSNIAAQFEANREALEKAIDYLSQKAA